MTIDEFNALPLEARRYIESQQTCLSCGKKNNLDNHYKNYLKMKQESLYTLRIGAISTKNEAGDVAILYPLNPTDTKQERLQKLELALRVGRVRPDMFSIINLEDIEKILKPKEEKKAKMPKAKKIKEDTNEAEN